MIARTGRPLSELATVMRRLPQVLVNVRVADREALDGAAAVWRAVEAEEARLGDRGRVLVRPSGTEALVRVMVEAETEEEARATADRLAVVVAVRAGLTPDGISAPTSSTPGPMRRRVLLRCPISLPGPRHETEVDDLGVAPHSRCPLLVTSARPGRPTAPIRIVAGRARSRRPGT